MGKKRRRPSAGASEDSVGAPPAQRPVRPLSSHQAALAEKLVSSRFRQLNETLYTSSSKGAWDMVQAEPGLFAAYHAGYATQARKWPINPLSTVIAYLKNSSDGPSVRRRKKKKCSRDNADRSTVSIARTVLTVADFGCGEARLADDLGKENFIVHSFDLEAANKAVVACDMAHVPLPSDSVNVAVFCLSLMGTNQTDFLKEANRVLNKSGRCVVVEVASRFAEVRGGFMAWAKAVQGRFGWELTTQRELAGGYFVFFVFQVGQREGRGNSSIKIPLLSPCMHKKR